MYGQNRAIHSRLTIKEIKINFEKLSNSLNIRLIKGKKKDILETKYMVDYINSGRNRVKKLIDLSIKKEFMVYCSELSFGILSYYSYINLAKMKM